MNKDATFRKDCQLSVTPCCCCLYLAIFIEALPLQMGVRLPTHCHSTTNTLVQPIGLCRLFGSARREKW